MVSIRPNVTPAVQNGTPGIVGSGPIWGDDSDATYVSYTSIKSGSTSSRVDASMAAWTPAVSTGLQFLKAWVKVADVTQTAASAAGVQLDIGLWTNDFGYYYGFEKVDLSRALPLGGGVFLVELPVVEQPYDVDPAVSLMSRLASETLQLYGRVLVPSESISWTGSAKVLEFGIEAREIPAASPSSVTLRPTDNATLSDENDATSLLMYHPDVPEVTVSLAPLAVSAASVQQMTLVVRARATDTMMATAVLKSGGVDVVAVSPGLDGALMIPAAPNPNIPTTFRFPIVDEFANDGTSMAAVAQMLTSGMDLTFGLQSTVGNIKLYDIALEVGYGPAGVACGVSADAITEDYSPGTAADWTPIMVGSGSVWSDGDDATGTVLERRWNNSPSFYASNSATGLLAAYAGDPVTQIDWIVRAAGESSVATQPQLGMDLFIDPYWDSPFYVEIETPPLPTDGVLRTYSGSLTDAYLAGYGTDVATVLAAMQAGDVTLQAYTFGVLAGPEDQWLRTFVASLLLIPCPTLRVQPPLRQYPRSDGLGASSARRMWPPPRSAQRSLRQGPGSHL